MTSQLVHFELPVPDPGRAREFHTDDIDASVVRLRDLGGQADGPQDIPPVGRFARCNDDQGTTFGLFQPVGSGETP